MLSEQTNLRDPCTETFEGVFIGDNREDGVGERTETGATDAV